ncbi:MAG: 30S ribosomal protein S5 [Candidatus Nanoarchaeia archaeon]|nr:30S ribosomal protein S5 [Candidatus Nanoarchaeia archaeon]
MKRKTKEEINELNAQTRKTSLEGWNPRTDIGRKVKAQKITDIDEILDKGLKILEPEIVDTLLPNLESDLIEFGQSKGKFGGGKRSIWRQTQKKTKEGNKPKFGALAVVGNKDGYVGIGRGKSKETVPAREKAVRQAKLNIIKIKRGCGSWECSCKTPHSVPFTVEGKSGSAKIILMPAPKGADLKVEKECQKVLRLAGFKDVYSKTFGQTRTKLNLMDALIVALKQLNTKKVSPEFKKKSGMTEGKNE